MASYTEIEVGGICCLILLQVPSIACSVACERLLFLLSTSVWLMVDNKSTLTASEWLVQLVDNKVHWQLQSDWYSINDTGAMVSHSIQDVSSAINCHSNTIASWTVIAKSIWCGVWYTASASQDHCWSVQGGLGWYGVLSCYSCALYTGFIRIWAPNGMIFRYIFVLT